MFRDISLAPHSITTFEQQTSPGLKHVCCHCKNGNVLLQCTTCVLYAFVKCSCFFTEAFKSEVRPLKSDVYSFAMVLYELVTGKTPFHDLANVSMVRCPVHSQNATSACARPRLVFAMCSHFDLFQNVQNFPVALHTPMHAQILNAIVQQKRPSLDGFSCPPSFRKLIEDCWVEEPEMRPDFEEVQPDVSMSDKQTSMSLHRSVSGCRGCSKRRRHIVFCTMWTTWGWIPHAASTSSSAPSPWRCGVPPLTRCCCVHCD